MGWGCFGGVVQLGACLVRLSGLRREDLLGQSDPYVIFRLGRAGGVSGVLFSLQLAWCGCPGCAVKTCRGLLGQSDPHVIFRVGQEWGWGGGSAGGNVRI